MADAPAPTRRRWRLPLLAALLVAGAALALWGWQRRAVEVAAIVPAAQPLLRTLQFSARVETPARVDIGATLTGRVAAVKVKEGERVAAGATLVELETDELRAALAQAQAALAEADSRVAGQRQAARPAADAALAQAEALLANAEREAARQRELQAQGFVSAARVDDAERARAVARAQRDGALAQAQAQRGGGAEVAAALAHRNAAAAALELARARLAQATLAAPAAGRVLVRAVEPGQIVQPGRALLTLAVDGPSELVATVDERYLAELALGQRASARADAYPAQPFAAEVARIAPAIDAARGAVEVHLRVAAPPSFLREDMTLSVEVVTGERERARAVPLAALRPGAAQAGAGPDAAAPPGAGATTQGQLLTVEQGRATPRTVRLGLRTLSAVEVVDGLGDGDPVLLDGRIEPGTRVRPALLDDAQARAALGRKSASESAGAALTSTVGR